MRVLIGAIVLAFGVSAMPAPGAACRCAPGDDAEHLAATPFVFAGRAQPSHDVLDRRSRLFVFEITETWKGQLPDTVVVRTNTSPATCGASFSPGKSYVVFATAFDRDTLETDSCRLAPYQSQPAQMSALMNNYRARVQSLDEQLSVSNGREAVELLAANNDWSSAIVVLDRLLQSIPVDQASLLETRGMANYRLLRLREAEADFAAALSLEPRSEPAQRGLEAVQRLSPLTAPKRHDAQRAWPELFEKSGAQ